MKRRVAILISGRGSNMAALIQAAAAKDFPAEIAVVISNRSAATGGLVYPVLALSKPGQIKVPSGETCPEILQISPSRRTLPLASSRSASG